MNPHTYTLGWWAAATGWLEHWNPFRAGTVSADSWREGHRDSVALERRAVPKVEPEVALILARSI